MRVRVRRSLAVAVCVFLAGLVAACDDDCNRPPILLYALFVEVTDAQTQEPICDAKVTLTNRVTETPGPVAGCTYAGGYHPGVYQVSVTRESYRPAQLSVEVAADSCDYAVERRITIELEPE